jgi:hypothetical protein
MVFHGVVLFFVPSVRVYSTGMIFLLRYPSYHFQILSIWPGNRATLSAQTTPSKRLSRRKLNCWLGCYFSVLVLLLMEFALSRKPNQGMGCHIHSRSTIVMRSCKGWLSALFMRFNAFMLLFTHLSAHGPVPPTRASTTESNSSPTSSTSKRIKQIYLAWLGGLLWKQSLRRF